MELETRGAYLAISPVSYLTDNGVEGQWLTLYSAEWARIMQIANENSFLMNYVNFWGHPDPDMLEVGNGDLTIEENRAHFALWAVMKSPLIIGTAVCDLFECSILMARYTYRSKARFYKR